MRLLAFVCLVALVGGLAAAILFWLGWAGMDGVAFLLGASALTLGFAVGSGPISTLGVTNHEPWPTLWPNRRGDSR